MQRLKVVWCVPLALVLVTGAPPALAQTQHSQDSVFYRFSDDDLLGDTLGTTPARLSVRPGAARVTLIRARASFVPEMLKSVEQM